jgi:hypothetical protein
MPFGRFVSALLFATDEMGYYSSCELLNRMTLMKM